MRIKLAGLLLGLALALPAAMPATAQEAPIEGTIRSQIEALKADDFVGAFTFASPSIQGIFGSAENFGRMVAQGYPMVYRPSEVRMGELRDVAGALWQKVYVTDATGKEHVLDYQMIETAEGWKINAVEVLKADDVGV